MYELKREEQNRLATFTYIDEKENASEFQHYE